MAQTNHSTGGMTFSSCLTLIFIVLKLLGLIDWSWLWVLAPVWIPPVFLIIVLLILIIIDGILKEID